MTTLPILPFQGKGGKKIQELSRKIKKPPEICLLVY
jgi:hypothetical protein